MTLASHPHPVARITSTLILIVAVFCVSHLMVLLAITAVLSVLACTMGSWKSYLLMLKVFAILAFGLIVVWAGIIGAPPGHPIASDWHGGLDYALFIVLRLLSVSSIGQICILGIPTSELPQVLATCGVRGNVLAAVIGAFVLVPEVELRMRQIVMARYARGLSKGRTFWKLATHIPATLRPILTWTLRSAIVRSEHWNQRKLIEELEYRSNALHWSIQDSSAWMLCSLILFGIVILFR